MGSVITSLLRMAATSYDIHYQGLSFSNTMQQAEMSYSNPRNLLHHVVFKLHKLPEYKRFLPSIVTFNLDLIVTL